MASTHENQKRKGGSGKISIHVVAMCGLGTDLVEKMVGPSDVDTHPKLFSVLSCSTNHVSIEKFETKSHGPKTIEIFTALCVCQKKKIAGTTVDILVPKWLSANTNWMEHVVSLRVPMPTQRFVDSF